MLSQGDLREGRQKVLETCLQFLYLIRAAMSPVRLSQAELDRRKTVGINPETVTNITATDFPGHYPGEDHAWSIEKFDRDLAVRFYKNEHDEATFSLIGVDASIANAFRRVLIAEVPSLAIENCFVLNNTSVIADEVLCHRLGLVPFKGSLKGLQQMRWFVKPDPEAGIPGTAVNDYNTIVLKLQIKCEWKPNPSDDPEAEAEDKYNNSSVYARDIVWEPMGRQAELFADGSIEPVNPDILLAKLRPGQEIDITMHAILGRGGDHAKFSPVGTATYRLLPKIDILKPILNQDAEKFAKCFPPGVIKVDRITPKEAQSNPELADHEGDKIARVQDPMRDTVSRECMRHDEFAKKVKLGRVQDHFIFNIESTGQFPSDVLFLQSIGVLKAKAKRLLKALDEEVPSQGV